MGMRIEGAKIRDKQTNKSTAVEGPEREGAGERVEEAERWRELQQPCSRKENLIIFSLLRFLG